MSKTYRESEAHIGEEGGADALRVYVPSRFSDMEMVLEIVAAGEKGLSVAMIENDVDCGESEYLALVDVRTVEGGYEVTANVVTTTGLVETDSGPLARAVLNPDSA